MTYIVYPGQVRCSPDILDLSTSNPEVVTRALQRHCSGDWGGTGLEGANYLAVKGGRGPVLTPLEESGVGMVLVTSEGITTIYGSGWGQYATLVQRIKQIVDTYAIKE